MFRIANLVFTKNIVDFAERVNVPPTWRQVENIRREVSRLLKNFGEGLRGPMFRGEFFDTPRPWGDEPPGMRRAPVLVRRTSR